MTRCIPYLIFSFCFSLMLALVVTQANAQDRGYDVTVPAGTLLRCTLNEPNFSSKTAEVGDPVICNLTGLILFGRTVFPRGAYLGGHLEADKDPGRLVGKGYLRLEFDHIGLPEGQLPLPAKIVGAKGYKVNKQGDIEGHGHATRDAVGWLIPPLWPVKILALPERGPRPTLKGEESLTLRLMDDVAIPTAPSTQAGSPSLGKPSSERLPGSYDVLPNRYIPAQAPPPRLAPVNSFQVAAAARVSSLPRASAESAVQNVLVLRNGLRYVATNVHVDGNNRLSYTLADGTARTARLEDVDWIKTFQGNAENGVALTLSGASSAR